MTTLRIRHSRVCLVFPATLLALLFVAAVALAACGGEAASGTPPSAASPSPTVFTSPPAASRSPTLWASPRPAVSYSRANPPSTQILAGRTASTTARVRKAGTIGWEFSPTVDIKVTALGCFDADRDGLARAHRVGIFDAESKRLLASVTVRPESRLDGFFRWEPLKTPLVLKEGLESGRHYLVATEDKGTLETLYTRRDWPNVEGIEETGAPAGEHWAKEIGPPALLGILASRSSQAAFAAPTVTQDLWNNPPWFSPNFKFRPVRVSPSPADPTSPPAPSQEPTSEEQPVSGPPQKPIIMSDGVYRWDAPGTASLTQTQAVARRYAASLSTEKIPGAGLYAANATWDFWAQSRRVRGAKNIQRVYREIAYEAGEHPFLSDEEPGWAFAKRSRSYHLLAAPGVAMCEGMFQFTNSIDSGPYLALLAVDGDRIAHEEIFAGGSRPVEFFDSEPGPGDTAKVAARVGAAAGAALATRDWPALQALLASDVLFRDVTNQQNVRGKHGVLSWWRTLAPANVVKIKNRAPIAGLGWAVVRWTGRRFYKNWYFPNGVDESRNGATVIEVRDGKVVRMTLYLEPGDGGGSILRPE